MATIEHANGTKHGTKSSKLAAARAAREAREVAAEKAADALFAVVAPVEPDPAAKPAESPISEAIRGAAESKPKRRADRAAAKRRVKLATLRVVVAKLASRSWDGVEEENVRAAIALLQETSAKVLGALKSGHGSLERGALVEIAPKYATRYAGVFSVGVRLVVDDASSRLARVLVTETNGTFARAFMPRAHLVTVNAGGAS